LLLACNRNRFGSASKNEPKTGLAFDDNYYPTKEQLMAYYNIDQKLIDTMTIAKTLNGNLVSPIDITNVTHNLFFSLSNWKGQYFCESSIEDFKKKYKILDGLQDGIEFKPIIKVSKNRELYQQYYKNILIENTIFDINREDKKISWIELSFAKNIDFDYRKIKSEEKVKKEILKWFKKNNIKLISELPFSSLTDSFFKEVLFAYDKETYKSFYFKSLLIRNKLKYLSHIDFNNVEHADPIYITGKEFQFKAQELRPIYEFEIHIFVNEKIVTCNLYVDAISMEIYRAKKNRNRTQSTSCNTSQNNTSFSKSFFAQTEAYGHKSINTSYYKRFFETEITVTDSTIKNGKLIHYYCPTYDTPCNSASKRDSVISIETTTTGDIDGNGTIDTAIKYTCKCCTLLNSATPPACIGFIESSGFGQFTYTYGTKIDTACLYTKDKVLLYDNDNKIIVYDDIYHNVHDTISKIFNKDELCDYDIDKVTQLFWAVQSTINFYKETPALSNIDNTYRIYANNPGGNHGFAGYAAAQYIEGGSGLGSALPGEGALHFKSSEFSYKTAAHEVTHSVIDMGYGAGIIDEGLASTMGLLLSLQNGYESNSSSFMNFYINHYGGESYPIYGSNAYNSFSTDHQKGSVITHFLGNLSLGASGVLPPECPTSGFTRNYCVKALGFETAKLIFMSWFMLKVPSMHSVYSLDIMRASMLSTLIDGSFEKMQVMNAWHSVGVGAPYTGVLNFNDVTFSSTTMEHIKNRNPIVLNNCKTTTGAKLHVSSSAKVTDINCDWSLNSLVILDTGYVSCEESFERMAKPADSVIAILPEVNANYVKPKNEITSVDSSKISLRIDSTSSYINVYPNPTTNSVFIQSNVPLDTPVVYNINGSRFTVPNSQLGAGVYSMDLSQLAAGVYIVRVGEYTAKVVKQ
jgi:hypothetical protein